MEGSRTNNLAHAVGSKLLIRMQHGQAALTNQIACLQHQKTVCWKACLPAFIRLSNADGLQTTNLTSMNRQQKSARMPAHHVPG